MLSHWKVKSKVMVGDMLNLPFKNNYFDAVVDVVSMQHLNWKEHDLSLKENHRVLKKGGLFFTFHLGGLSTASGKGEKIDKFTIKNIPPNFPLANNGPTCFPSFLEYKKKISKNGFEVVSAETMERTYKQRKQKVEYIIISGRKI